jgi:glucokinase
MELIAGDIGGTKSWLAWVDTQADATQSPRFEKRYASADFESGAALLAQFVADAAQPFPPDAAILALPGPLDAQRVVLTNLDWTLDATELAKALAIPRVHFVNDFQAAAAGVATLGEQDRIVLNPGAPRAGGVRAITGAGTGLGLAFMTPEANGWRTHPSEGGHADFAPAGAAQARLLDFLRARHGHVSWERALSGSALDDLYRFTCIERGQPLPEAVMDGALLAARAVSGDDAAAEAAIGLFVDLYGAWVGNVALLYQPAGGLYIAGGIAVHWADRLDSPRFMAAALDKGRMRSVVERTPIHLITCARLGVQGAIELARTLPAHERLNSNTAVTRSGT